MGNKESKTKNFEYFQVIERKRVGIARVCWGETINYGEA